ncbi:HWE histidine kinase domain-containing protein [Falsiroseomonas sp.]|uniref:HWE histidine kinase domain-containing protein n=1 Tax=Falsiroseomonas sp. TaxID=2870721 RepID=UPI003F72E463
MIGFDLGSEAGRERARLAMENFGIAFFESNMATGLVVVSPNAFAMFGLPVPPHMPVERTGFWECYHPEDLAAARATFEADLRGERHRDIYCERVRIIRQTDRAIRHIEFLGRMFGPPGARTHIVGMLRDVTDLAEAEARRSLLVREVNHRANNTLAVVQSLVRLTQAADVPDYKRRLEGRILSLARTQTLVDQTAQRPAAFALLIASELAAYRDHITLEADEVPDLVAPAVQPVAMILYEMATNAAKHGALAAPQGQVRIAARPEGSEVVLRWVEQGGAPLTTPPTRKGTGMAVIQSQIRRLGGTQRLEWSPDGLRAELRFPLSGWAGQPPDDQSKP